jgi:hypothetical protein
LETSAHRPNLVLAQAAESARSLGYRKNGRSWPMRLALLQASTATFSRSSVSVKNVTVSPPDSVYRRARIRAAEEDSSLSALVQRLLITYTRQESDFERRKRLQTEVLGTIVGFSAGDRLSRDEVHNRKRHRARA